MMDGTRWLGRVQKGEGWGVKGTSLVVLVENGELVVAIDIYD